MLTNTAKAQKLQEASTSKNTGTVNTPPKVRITILNIIKPTAESMCVD